MMRARLLEYPPEAGVPVVRFGAQVAGDSTWVCFEGIGTEPWVGAFRNGDVAFYSTAIPFGDDGGRTMLVVARGQGYVVDVSTRALLRQTPWDYSYTALTVPGREFVVVADTTDIWLAYRDEDVRPTVTGNPMPWSDPHRLALDGLVLDDPSPDALTGKAWQPDGWYTFRMRYADRVAELGVLVTRDEDAFQATPSRGGYPTSQAYYDWIQQFWF